MNPDIAMTILLEHVIRPHLNHSSFADTKVALDICAAMTMLTGHAWTIAPHPTNPRLHIILEWTP